MSAESVDSEVGSSEQENSIEFEQVPELQTPVAEEEPSHKREAEFEKIFECQDHWNEDWLE